MNRQNHKPNNFFGVPKTRAPLPKSPSLSILLPSILALPFRSFRTVKGLSAAIGELAVERRDDLDDLPCLPQSESPEAELPETVLLRLMIRRGWGSEIEDS